MKVISTLAVLLLVFTANAIKLQHEGIDATHASAVASHDELALLHDLADKGDTLGNGESLSAGSFLSSVNGYFAVFRVDGNLVIYNSENFTPDNIAWASNSYGKGASPRHIGMQNDGNLVIYDAEGRATWASGTQGKGRSPFKLVMQTDRNLVIYDGTGVPTWSTGTNI
jgi:hypothetical protein